jgi:hypothetical protein
VEKYSRARQAADITIVRRMRAACWIPKTKDKHSTMGICCFSTATVVMRTRLYVTLHVHCPSCLNAVPGPQKRHEKRPLYWDSCICAVCPQQSLLAEFSISFQAPAPPSPRCRFVSPYAVIRECSQGFIVPLRLL